jgi:hypothetical protein
MMSHFKKNCQLQGLESIFQTIRTGKNSWTDGADYSTHPLGQKYI